MFNISDITNKTANKQTVDFQYFIPEFRICHILTGGSRSFGYGSTWKCNKIQNVKDGKYMNNASNNRFP
jgi:hypothetical protein